jgi:hypothetical protein
MAVAGQPEGCCSAPPMAPFPRSMRSVPQGARVASVAPQAEDISARSHLRGCGASVVTVPWVQP